MNLYAFWAYGHYPYLLHGEVTKMYENGQVQIKGYGPGFAFTPVKLLPIEAGKALGVQLDALKIEYLKVKHAFHVEWDTRRVAVARAAASERRTTARLPGPCSPWGVSGMFGRGFGTRERPSGWSHGAALRMTGAFPFPTTNRQAPLDGGYPPP